MKPQTPKAKNAEHLDYIRNLPCLVCGDNTSTEAAHVRRADARAAKKITGTGIKPRDCWVVPLCSRHHRRQHEVGEAHFWDGWGIDPVFKAMAFWVHSGDIEAGEEIAKNK